MTEMMTVLLKFLATRVHMRGAKIIVVLVLMAHGLSNKEIRETYGFAWDSLRKYRNALVTENIPSLFEMDISKRQKSELEKYNEEIDAAFEENPPKTLREARERIFEITGLRRSLTRIRNYLLKKGAKSRVVGFIPAKANPAEQRRFLAETLMPLIESAKNGKIALYFLDASHFVMGAFSGRVWSVVRKYVKTASGRQRYNVLGALNFVTKKVETIVNSTYITATQVMEMLDKLAALHVGQKISIVLDNARYQRCKTVQNYAKILGIELVFLPTYSPNLNLIERVWKLVKSEVLNACYHGTYNTFCNTIISCIGTLDTKFKNRMDSLVTENFHIVDEKDVIATTILSS